MFKSDEISLEYLLFFIFKYKDNFVLKILNQFDVDYDIYKVELEYVCQEQDFMSLFELFVQIFFDQDDFYEDDEGQGSGWYQQCKGIFKFCMLVFDNFGCDIIKLVEEDKLDFIIGCENEIEWVF